MPGYRVTAWLRPLLTLAALAGVLSLAACGGGNGAPNNPYQPGAGPLTITPTTATGYSGVPFMFSVTGGTAPYSVISSDSVILPVTSGVSGNSLVVVPGNVVAATSVSFTVSDSAGHQVTGSLNVNPALLLPASITITGNPNCAASGATLCSGQDGSASVKVTGPGGAGLAGRSVRFDVVQGDFTISPPGQASVPTLTVTTDQNGNATVRLLVSVSAATQIASIRATDVTSGSNVLGQFTIAQYVNGSSILSVLPSGTTTFTGPDTATCNAGGQATFYIFGGTPPYTVTTNFPQAITIRGAPVQHSGGGFTITTTGICFTNLTFAITDATGRVLLNPPTATNGFGTAAAAPPPLNVTPGSLSGTCSSGSTFSFLATGGTGTYTNAVNPEAGATGTATVSPSGANVTVSFSAPATGKFDVNVASGSQIVTAVLTCN
ncbi:MAG: hypothetical protein KGJ99_03305 [Betaproteobacteria bacterium]|nr:hypothetical protein [Betaproteobacteria bacterium]